MVKLIAREEASGIAKKVAMEEVDKLRQEILKDKLNIALVNALDRAGGAWNSKEDALLKSELETAIKTIACNHERTEGAITARIKHRDLLLYLFQGGC